MHHNFLGVQNYSYPGGPWRGCCLKQMVYVISNETFNKV